MTTYSTIDDLPAGTPAGTDKLEVSQGGVSRRVTFAQVGAGAGVLPFLPLAGGTLTGTLNGTVASFSGEITAATPALADNDTTVATTAFVKGQNYAGAAGFLPIGGGTLTGPLAGTTAAFSGSVTMPTQAPGTNNTTGATTAFVGVANAALAPLASPTFTGDPKAPTPAPLDNDTSIATTAFVTAAVAAVSGGGPFLPTAGGTLTGPLTGTKVTLSSTLGVGVNARASTPLDAMNLADTTGFSNIAFLRQANNPGGTNYTQLIVEQNATNVVNFEVADQANVKGTLNLQPFGGTVSIPTLTGTTATFSGTVSASGAQIQMVNVQTGAVATGTTIIPVDDTIPQITEGNEYMTLAVTPKSATSKLVIEVTAHLTSSVAGGTMVAALFQDAAANALACTMATLANAGGPGTFTFSHVMTSGTTSATTFRVRGGYSAAATTTFNGSGGARFYGGVLASSIVIREVAP